MLAARRVIKIYTQDERRRIRENTSYQQVTFQVSWVVRHLISWCPLVPKFSIEANPSTGATVYRYGAHEHRGVREQQGAEGEGVRAYG
jgi:hypothetical protein